MGVGMKVRKAVFPVAGMGTRFLPATKANPKEMLPVVDKPLIQYAAEEAVAAGIDTLIFIIGRNKRAIPDHFDKAYELEAELEAKGKQALLKQVQGILPAHVSCVYLRQAEALGLGHAVACARPVVNDEPFAVILADDLIDGSEANPLAEMLAVAEVRQGSVLGAQRVPAEEISRYGVIEGDEIDAGLWRCSGIVEKPPAEEAPSDVAVVGRYVLSGRIFSMLERIDRGAGGEYQLTDAIALLLQEEPVFAHTFRGKRYDCGSKEGFLEATVEYALRHPELRDSFRSYLKGLAETL
ncbi:MAG: UTP--glucose-1-phosphate uridylyltransferase [Gammaproteobacteria bacterium]|nr:MAG: UTP--glucose-1-phosphate uridylyltransferase [Gammaproteobacteria bacterium]